MFLVARSTGGLRLSLSWRCRRTASFSSSSVTFTGHPNQPLHLDPSLKALLKDVDISLIQSRARPPPQRKELEAFPVENQAEEISLVDEIDQGEYSQRKSPAAHFGSQQIGAVVIPTQLQNSINVMIAESDRAQLHSDAKRLFYDGDAIDGSENEWETQYDSKYRTWRQKSRHAERDGTAFASIALPAHYSAIVSVFNHIKQRLGPSWELEKVIDWGAGTGSGLWASLYSFQKPTTLENENSPQDRKIANSTITTYLGIDKREGLTSIGKRLFRDLDLGKLSLSWQKSFKDDDKLRRSDGYDTLALSAFMLTTLPTPQARKTLVKEMWESGAHTIVLIDHNTTAGFEAIAQAREYLLDMGRKETVDTKADDLAIRGSHVVAPCPHDGACPLFHPGSSRLVCGFKQRIQRPSFVRLTKHSNVGHEDIEYSYVVVRRGSRPISSNTAIGRIGEVGKRALDKEASSRAPIRELTVHNELDSLPIVERPDLVSENYIDTEMDRVTPQTHAELQDALRLEAYSWPRLVFPPLKKNGHVILDSCTAEGKIMRLTIPRSQGKQEYYDARKSSWGDIFPHPPKNPPQERYQPLRTKREGGTIPIIGSDIGKRRHSERKKVRASYNTLSEDIKDKRKTSRRDRIQHLEADK